MREVTYERDHLVVITVVDNVMPRFVQRVFCKKMYIEKYDIKYRNNNKKKIIMGVNGNCNISNQPLSRLNRYLAFRQNPLCKKMSIRYQQIKRDDSLSATPSDDFLLKHLLTDSI